MSYGRRVRIAALFFLLALSLSTAANESCGNLTVTPNTGFAGQQLSVAFDAVGNASGIVTCSGAEIRQPQVNCQGTHPTCTAVCSWSLPGSFSVLASYGPANCSPTAVTIYAVDTPTPTATENPTATPTDTPSATPNATATPTPSETPTPSVNATITPTPEAQYNGSNESQTPTPTVSQLLPTPTLPPFPTWPDAPSPSPTLLPTAPVQQPPTAIPTDANTDALTGKFDQEYSVTSREVELQPESAEKSQWVEMLRQSQDLKSKNQVSAAQNLLVRIRSQLASKQTYKTDRTTPISYAEIAIGLLLVAVVIWGVFAFTRVGRPPHIPQDGEESKR